MKKSSKSKGLVHSSFPQLGTAQPASMGSQSNPPIQQDPYQPDTTTGIPSIDRMLYQ